MSDTLEYNWHTFPYLGYITSKLSEEQLQPIQAEINSIQEDFSKADSASDYLSGLMDHEYNLYDSRNHIDSLIRPLCYEYDKTFRLSSQHLALQDQGKWNVELKELWVNYQKKHEFQSAHKHSGIFSFVIWMKIPYDVDKETSKYTGRSKDVSQFGFSYNNTLGAQERFNLNLSNKDEGMLAVFPAQMPHYVYPFFTSNDYRITIAGNYGVKDFIKE